MKSVKEYVKIRKAELKEKVSSMKEKPCLAVIQIGNNAASNSYVKGKRKDCEEIGIEFYHLHIEDNDDLSTESVLEYIDITRNLVNPSGIIVQLPIPDKLDYERIKDAIGTLEDVDGFIEQSPYDPCTPKGVVDYLKFNNYEFDGKHACVIGRSDIVGKPLEKMLLNLNCTVSICHSKTTEIDLQDLIACSDIVFTCINQIEYFDKQWFHKRNDVIDIGLGRGKDGKLHGNLTKNSVDYLKNMGSFVISGTGGVGLLTRLALMENVIKAQEYILGKE